MPLGTHKAALFGVAGVSTGDVVLLSTQTASDSASLDFTSGIDSTYGEYIFKFYNINPATDQTTFQFNGSIDGGSNYNVTKTTSYFAAYHQEDDGAAALGYEATHDIAQGTGFQKLANATSNDADQHVSGELHLFNPSSTTYVKHFYARTVSVYDAATSQHDDHIAGYFNDTNDIDAVQFKMSSGNFDGTIKMWGVK
jgi:hypothetical protein